MLDYLAERERTHDTDPFLIYCGFSHPHDTRDGTPELLTRYGATNHADPATLPPADPRQPPLPPNWLPRHPFDHGLQGKQNLYEHTWRVPFIVRGPGVKPGIRCVRKGEWKLVKYESPSGGLHTQLFNLNENPHEFLAEHHDPAVTDLSRAAPTTGQKNLADDPAFAATRAEMKALLLAEMQRHDDPFRFSDQSPP